ncbi:hypothetical protein HB364_10260 [Pseudoflavitalea sp. X16]|uniref:hypothetical protein n=1 Tax=Paraflavitalea devenefica TaxID=2716334 RepID=UPI0014233A43|nr:hypothetical protein [Paraflavitalea devenefica]NII25466.1 hypothetical protein [Paraflavitalea devenefica]
MSLITNNEVNKFLEVAATETSTRMKAIAEVRKAHHDFHSLYKFVSSQYNDNIPPDVLQMLQEEAHYFAAKYNSNPGKK